MYQLDLQSRVPIHQQLKEKILRLVMLGAIGPGDPLPSVRMMARDLGINPNTVAKAYQELEREGYIYSVAGKGSFIGGAEEINRQLSTQILERLRDVLREAKGAGVPRRDIESAVEAVYGGVNR